MPFTSVVSNKTRQNKQMKLNQIQIIPLPSFNGASGTSPSLRTLISHWPSDTHSLLVVDSSSLGGATDSDSVDGVGGRGDGGSGDAVFKGKLQFVTA
jgi:hypothetical protein